MKNILWKNRVNTPNYASNVESLTFAKILE